MTVSTLAGSEIVGISAAVPSHTVHWHAYREVFGQETAKKISDHTGIQTRHVASHDVCTSDLCCVAAENLLQELRWDRSSIDAIIFVTQTPDHLLPASSCGLHKRLGLSKHCAAFDVNLGCSGYVYGMWLASLLITGGGASRVLLLVGDTISRIVSPLDRSAAMLFGDAGTATALQASSDSAPMLIELGTDGSGFNRIIVPAGLFRHPPTESTRSRTVREGGNVRSDEDLHMEGTEVFGFTIREVVPLIRGLMKKAGWSSETVDAVVMHQANDFMLQHLGKKLGLPKDKIPSSLAGYGNTSSASIPVTMLVCLGERLRSESLRLVLAGFGVGWSWGAIALACGPMAMCGPLVVSGEEHVPPRSSEDNA